VLKGSSTTSRQRVDEKAHHEHDDEAEGLRHQQHDGPDDEVDQAQHQRRGCSHGQDRRAFLRRQADARQQRRGRQQRQGVHRPDSDETQEHVQ
jgi:hypothetical protein